MSVRPQRRRGGALCFAHDRGLQLVLIARRGMGIEEHNDVHVEIVILHASHRRDGSIRNLFAHGRFSAKGDGKLFPRTPPQMAPHTAEGISGNVSSELKGRSIALLATVAELSDQFASTILDRIRIVSINLNPQAAGQKKECVLICEIDVTRGKSGTVPPTNTYKI